MGLFKPNIEKMKSAGDSKVLIKALEHDNSDVRKSAAAALGQIKEENAIQPLIALMKDDDLNVRMSAAEALGQIGPSVSEPILAALKENGIDFQLKVASTLGSMDDKRAVQSLIGAIEEIEAFNLKMRIDSNKEAIKYLNECGTFTLDKHKEAYRIAKSPVQEAKILEMWKVEPILGSETIREGDIELFTKVITEFQRRLDQKSI